MSKSRTDDVDIIDCFVNLFRYKRAIFLTILLFLLVGAIFSLLTPKVYRVKAVMQNGYFTINEERCVSIKKEFYLTAKEAEIIISAGAYTKNITEQYDVIDVKALPIADTDFFMLQVDGKNAKKAYAFIEKVIEGYLEYAESVVKQYKVSFPTLVSLREFKVIASPVSPTSYVRPDWALNMFISLFIGVLVGLFTAFFRSIDVAQKKDGGKK